MKLLLDTHVLAWSLGFTGQLTPKVRRLLQSPSNQIFYSTANLFELATKRAAGHRHRSEPDPQLLLNLAEAAGYNLLLINAAHAIAVETIAPFHGDPIDRLLLAQAQIEGMRLVTHDEKLASYDSGAILF